MSSQSSTGVPILRWVIWAILAAFIGLAITSQMPGFQPMLSPGLNQANATLAQGDIKKATAQFDAEVRNDPGNPAVYDAIAAICAQNKHTDLAINYMERSLGPCKDLPRPERAQLYLRLSALYSTSEPKPQRKAVYAAQRAAELDPSDPINLNQYGYLLADNTTNRADLDVAVAKLTLALELLKKQGNSPEVRDQISETEDSYGWALYKLGKYDLASAALYQAINDVPEESTGSPSLAEQMKVLYYHLGASYHQQHKPDESRKALQTALSFDKEYKEAKDELDALNRDFPPPIKNPATPAGNAGKPASSPASAPAAPRNPPVKTPTPGKKV